MQEQKTEFVNDLKKGEYSAGVKVIFEKEVIAEEKLIFTILDADVKEQDMGEMSLLRTKYILWFLGFIFIATPLLIVLTRLLKRKFI